MARLAAARVINTTFQINAARPAFAAYRVRILGVGAADIGQIALLSDKASPPTTVIALIRSPILAAGEIFDTMIYALVQPGDNVRLDASNIAGAPTQSIQGQAETVI